MQFFEIVFLLLLTVSIVRLLFGAIHPLLNYAPIASIGLALIVLGVIFEGWRWQMLPAYLGFAVLMLASLKRSGTKRSLRVVGALPIIILLVASAFLTHQLPIRSLPAPTGPYAVGTFEYTTIDPSRPDPYAPERQRELYVEVWYPADDSTAHDFPVSTLAQDLNQGSYELRSFLFGYLSHINTHSHVKAPVAALENSSIPVLLFNHGANLGFTSQNILLMEHLASNGYVVLGIGHGTTDSLREVSSDEGFDRADMDLSLMSKVRQTYNNDYVKSAGIQSIIKGLEQDYAMAKSERAKKAVLVNAMTKEELQPFKHFINEKLLGDYLLNSRFNARAVQTWVEDIQFIADTIPELQAPVAGFSKILDTSGFGVFGMSFGGAAAEEFCKIDNRCKAGTNLDGPQLGDHWNQKLVAPFLMMYREEYQGGNDYAYVQSDHDFWDYGVRGSTHADFVDVTYIMPLIKTLGLGGEIDMRRMIDIVNTVQLDFFDHYLKGKPIPGELSKGIPEIVTRENWIETLTSQNSE